MYKKTNILWKHFIYKIIKNSVKQKLNKSIWTSLANFIILIIDDA